MLPGWTVAAKVDASAGNAGAGVDPKEEATGNVAATSGVALVATAVPCGGDKGWLAAMVAGVPVGKAAVEGSICRCTGNGDGSDGGATTAGWASLPGAAKAGRWTGHDAALKTGLSIVGGADVATGVVG